MSRCPERRLSKAILVPSGDQAGSAAEVGLVVSRFRLLPSAWMV
jgi:hypothetical protein